MYHWRNGLFFGRREGDGSVRVLRLEPPHDGKFPDPDGANPEATLDLVIPASEWASIVASVSARNETAETWEAALEFHNRRA